MVGKFNPSRRRLGTGFSIYRYKSYLWTSTLFTFTCDKSIKSGPHLPTVSSGSVYEQAVFKMAREAREEGTVQETSGSPPPSSVKETELSYVCLCF